MFGKDYSEVEAEVHGGLTFANACQGQEENPFGICHIPEAGRPEKVWWFGFDCAHCFDLSPWYRVAEDDVYRTLEYVKGECAQLARQLSPK